MQIESISSCMEIGLLPCIYVCIKNSLYNLKILRMEYKYELSVFAFVKNERANDPWTKQGQTATTSLEVRQRDD